MCDLECRKLVTLMADFVGVRKANELVVLLESIRLVLINDHQERNIYRGELEDSNCEERKNQNTRLRFQES